MVFDRFMNIDSKCSVFSSAVCNYHKLWQWDNSESYAL